MSNHRETPVETKARERAYLVKWMRSVLAEKEDLAAQKAFMAKVDAVVTHHGITLEELLNNPPNIS